MFCKHKWKKLSETTTESKIKHATMALKEAGTLKSPLPWQLCDANRKHIQVFSCDECGKLKRFVTDI
jgi:hypothetical protein